jgi:hypothetical protein
MAKSKPAADADFSRRAIISSVVSILAGAVLGYAALHPLSVVIVYLFEKRMFDGVSILSESFALEHVAMGVFFALIGGFIGALFAAYRHRARKTNRALTGIIHDLQGHNRRLLEKARAESNDPDFVSHLWIALNKVDKGVGLVSSGGMGELTRRQTELLDITRDNIEDIFRLLEKNIPVEKRKET